MARAADVKRKVLHFLKEYSVITYHKDQGENDDIDKIIGIPVDRETERGVVIRVLTDLMEEGIIKRVFYESDEPRVRSQKAAWVLAEELDSVYYKTEISLEVGLQICDILANLADIRGIDPAKIGREEIAALIALSGLTQLGNIKDQMEAAGDDADQKSFLQLIGGADALDVNPPEEPTDDQDNDDEEDDKLIGDLDDE